MGIIWSWNKKRSNVTQKHLREKGTYDQQKVLCIEIPNGCTVRKTYQPCSSLCCFALLPAEPDTISPSLQRWEHLWWVQQNVKTENFHSNFMLKGQNLRDWVFFTECGFTHILLFFFFPYISADIFLSYGAVFSFPYMQNGCTCMHKAAEYFSGCSVHMNTIEGKHLCFGGKK